MAKYADLFRATGAGEKPASTGSPEKVPSEPRPFALLFVDDEENVLRALKRVFRHENYNILTASSAEAALKMIEATPAHLLVSDYKMPGMDGAQLLKQVKEKWPETIRIMLTGYADIQAIMGAVNEGAVYKFITKPWNDEDLRLTVSLALQQYDLIQENKRLKETARSQQRKISDYSKLFDEYRGILGKVLLQEGAITEENLRKAVHECQKDEPLVDAVSRLGFASEASIVQAIQKNQGIQSIDLKEVSIHANVAKIFSFDFCEKNRLIPVRLEEKNLTLAMADPTDILKIDHIAMLTGFRVVPLVARSSEILAQIRAIHGVNGKTDSIETCAELLEFEPVEEIDIVIEDDDGQVNVQELIDSSGVPPIVRIVNATILEALRYRASDIHIEPKTKSTLVRFRIDGLLYTKIKIPPSLHPAVISRIKILAKLDISERRKPQDGRMTVRTGTRIVDMRVSTMPTINGEKVVMRVLDKNSCIKRISDLGMLSRDLELLEMVIKKPQGILISTGPTGSGKTTMLYSILYEMVKSIKNYETIEDPIEYFLEDVNQVHVQDRIGLSFASILRATLRQDPDVLLVGEIRDFETADVAFKAALTGHLVLTSLHTNNTVASITRLVDIGVQPYLISSAIETIIAQRLVRRICPKCKTSAAPDKETLQLLRIPENSLGEIAVGKGCHECNQTGYQGRIGIFELFVINDELRYHISVNSKESEIFALARSYGMRTLVEDAIEKVRLGLTTLEELLRIFGPPTVYERLCDKCGKKIDIKYLFCPYCGEFKRNICPKCRLPLDEEWTVCPVCGTAKKSDAVTLLEKSAQRH